MFSRIDVKLSKELLEIGEYEEFAELEGLTITRRVRFGEPEDKGYRFTGRLFLLTGPYTFSSAADFAAVVKDFGIGTLIGEETGGLRQSFGDTLPFSLPHSGIGCNVSHKRFYAPLPEPGDDSHGTIPDIVVDEGMLSRYLDARDPILAFVLDYVQNN
jgi:C-terminal processing protease CtpA/Prc